MAKPFDLFHTYMRAFKAGVSRSELSGWHKIAQSHEDREIRAAWRDGYAAGVDARERACAKASELYGHKPSPLKVQGDV